MKRVDNYCISLYIIYTQSYIVICLYIHPLTWQGKKVLTVANQLQELAGARLLALLDENSAQSIKVFVSTLPEEKTCLDHCSEEASKLTYNITFFFTLTAQIILNFKS